MVLILQHQPDDGPGNLAGWLVDHGVPYTIIDVSTAELPAPGRFDALVVLGSKRSAYETGEPWIRAEHDFVRGCVDAGTSVLGICFGAQLLALVLGGEVRRMAQPELGWYPVSGAPPYGGTWFVWHGDEITAPPGSTILATTPICTHAFAHGSNLGVQFHPELTAELLGHWIGTPRRRRAVIDAGGDIEQIRTATTIFEPDAVAAAGRLYDQFFSSLVAHHDSGDTTYPHASPAR
ncbi:type 1 glutamine amidotransferase [Mycobacterium sp. NPDC003449]